MSFLSTTFVASSIYWLIGSSLWIYSHSVLNFNESVGGQHDAPKHLLGRNVDWRHGRRYFRWSIACLAEFQRWATVTFTGSLLLLLFGDSRLVPATDIGQKRHSFVSRHQSYCRTAFFKLPALIGLSFCVVCVCWAGFLYQRVAVERIKPLSYESFALLREKPIQLGANTPSIILKTSDDFGSIFNKLDPSNQKDKLKLSASQCLHLLTAFGLDAKFADRRFPSGKDLLRVLTDSRQATEYFGHPVMLSTRHGVRPCSGKDFELASQAHRDQLLSCVAQLGVAFDYPLIVEGEPREFGDIIRDSIANFHLGQEEIEFTAIAYALYLPPNRAWINKLGEEYTFDDLVNELLRRELNQSHCFGAHLVEAMTVIDRVDSEFDPILSKTSRSQLREHLDLVVKTILREQDDDGSWGPQWHYDLLSDDARHRAPSETKTQNRLLATAHITQLLARLSLKRYPLDRSMFRRAVAWLNYTTAEVDQDFVFNNFCPCTHAAWCLSRFGGDSSPPTLVSDHNTLSTVAE